MLVVLVLVLVLGVMGTIEESFLPKGFVSEFLGVDGKDDASFDADPLPVTDAEDDVISDDSEGAMEVGEPTVIFDFLTFPFTGILLSLDGNLLIK